MSTTELYTSAADAPSPAPPFPPIDIEGARFLLETARCRLCAACALRTAGILHLGPEIRELQDQENALERIISAFEAGQPVTYGSDGYTARIELQGARFRELGVRKRRHAKYGRIGERVPS